MIPTGAAPLGFAPFGMLRARPAILPATVPTNEIKSTGRQLGLLDALSEEGPSRSASGELTADTGQHVDWEGHDVQPCATSYLHLLRQNCQVVRALAFFSKNSNIQPIFISIVQSCVKCESVCGKQAIERVSPPANLGTFVHRAHAHIHFAGNTAHRVIVLTLEDWETPRAWREAYCKVDLEAARGDLLMGDLRTEVVRLVGECWR